ncbi:SPT3 Dosage dependent suppressor of Ty-induced promoter mutations-like protein [Mortierella sp. AD010]|nr:SPT3 Dosage dependent suppressor of Ty-induced promoter mutations-like protein [Mortierella sp. AD010]
MPPHSVSNLLQTLGQSDLTSFDTTFLHQQEESTIRMGDMRKAQLATPEWNDALLYSLTDSLGRQVSNKPTVTNRLNVKTHVFKKELQEYVPTQIEDRLRIETIIYVELSIVDQNGALVNAYDYARLPKDLFFSQPDKVMSPEEMGTKRIIDIAATLQCPSNNWQEEKEACLRCARRMSAKLDQTESRIMHMLPELHRTETGDALISFRSGVANIQFKINCYCGHKKEKEGFVIRFDSRSDATVASHVTLPLMLYHQNKNRVASRAIAAAAKAQAKSDQQPEQPSNARNVVKSVTSKTKRESRSKPGHSPIGNQQHQIPSPPNSLLDSPVEWTSSPEMDDIMDSSDIPFTVPSPPPPDPLISLFPESISKEQQQQQQPTVALISHMTPNSGPVRGGTLVTIHGTGFTVGEVMYVCFGENIVPIIPQRDHMLECITPASNKAETVPVFAMNAIESNVAQTTFTYVDDNEKELIKLALQRMMNISARMEGPVDSVLNRANEFALWSDLLQGDDSSSTSTLSGGSYSNLEKMVIESFQILDTPSAKNVEGLSIVNNTGHTMLHLAVSLQYESLVKDLMLRSVDMAIQDKNGLTALDWAHRLNDQNMVSLLSGATVDSLVAPAFDARDKLAFAAECDEVAHGLTLSVSPGSRPTATDQPNVDYGHGGIAAHDVIQLGRTVTKEPTLDLTDQVDPHLGVEWEGFGQGPGKDVLMGDGVVHGLFETQHEDSFFVQQAQKDPPRLAGEVVDQDGRFAIQQHQKQPQQDQPQYQKVLSAIPTSSVERLMGFSPPQDCYSPPPLHRIPTDDVVKVGRAGEIDPATAAIPWCGLDSVRLPVGGLDHIAPADQDMVATEGCTGEAAADKVVLPSKVGADQSHGVPGSGSIQSITGSSNTQSIMNTARIDFPRLDIQESAAAGVVVVDDAVDVHGQDQDPRQLYLTERHFEQVMSENPVLQAQEGEVVVAGQVVVDGDDGEGGSHNSTAVQAVVQNSRIDVESEPLLFLGGLPVPVSPRSIRTAPMVVPNSAIAIEMKESEDDTTKQESSPSAGSEDEA